MAFPPPPSPIWVDDAFFGVVADDFVASAAVHVAAFDIVFVACFSLVAAIYSGAAATPQAALTVVVDIFTNFLTSRIFQWRSLSIIST